MPGDSFPARIRPLAADDLEQIVRYLDAQSDQAANLFRDEILRHRTAVRTSASRGDSAHARPAQGPAILAIERVRELPRVLSAHPRRDRGGAHSARRA